MRLSRLCFQTAILLLIAASIATGGEPATWPEFSPPQAGFSVRMPGTPTHEFDAAASTDTFQVREGDQVWSASVVYLPREVREMPPQRILDQTKASFLRLFPNSRLVSSEPVKLGGFPGFKCVIQSHAQGRPEFIFKASVVVANGRMFSVGFAGRKDAFNEVEVEKYLGTFQLR